ncbi:MAG: YceI family protein [Proteobacteria bacterium]|nr:YceI family protein [Pseudomonadota bacterium]
MKLSLATAVALAVLAAVLTASRGAGAVSVAKAAAVTSPAPAPANPAGAAPSPTTSSTATAAPAALAADPARSVLGFTGIQAGAEFKGVFKKFSARVSLDPAQLATSRIEVHIDTHSVDTQDGERDSNIRGADFFDVAHHPQATYVTRAIAQTAKGFSATGTLTLRGVSRDVPLEFTFTRTGAGGTLTGTTAVKRLDFGVGQGEWKSTEWVGNEVKINFSLNLKPTS